MERRTWLIVLALAVLVAGTEWLLWVTRDRSNEQTFAGPPRSDYTLQDFTLNALDAAGRPSFEIRGPRLARRGDDGSIYVSTPDYVLVDANGLPWTGRSEAAWVNHDGSLMKLEGRVQMQRAGGEDDKPVEVVTRDLTTWPKDKKMETAAPVTITQPGSILRGTGLRGDLDSKTLELLSDVHSTLQPQRPSRPRK